MDGDDNIPHDDLQECLTATPDSDNSLGLTSLTVDENEVNRGSFSYRLTESLPLYEGDRGKNYSLATTLSLVDSTISKPQSNFSSNCDQAETRNTWPSGEMTFSIYSLESETEYMKSEQKTSGVGENIYPAGAEYGLSKTLESLPLSEGNSSSPATQDRFHTLKSVVNGPPKSAYGLTLPQTTQAADYSKNIQWESKSHQKLGKVYDSLLHDIAVILAGYDDIIAPLYCPSPQNYNKLLVQGPGVAKAKDTIKQLMYKYPDYEIIVSDCQPVMRSKDNNLPIYTHPLGGNITAAPYYVHRLPTEGNYASTVGTFLRDEYFRAHGKIFGATSAHSLLTIEQQEKLAEHRVSKDFQALTREIIQELNRKNSSEEQLHIAAHNQTSVRVRDDPLIAYTHMIPAPGSDLPELKPFQKFASDIALLSVDANPFNDLKIAANVLMPVFKRDTKPQLLHMPIKGIMDIKDAADLAALRDRKFKVIIDGFTNVTLQIQPKTFTKAVHNNGKTSTQPWMIAPHFAFTTDKPLFPGMSGTPLMAHHQNEDALYIIGLLMGSFKGTLEWCTDVLYQAMPLGPALKQLMYLHDNQLSGLQPLNEDQRVLPLANFLPFTTVDEISMQSNIELSMVSNIAVSSEDTGTGSLMKDLVKRGPLEGYHPIPMAMKQWITRIALEYNVKCGAIYQSPEDPKELQIIGINASCIPAAVIQAHHDFPEFSITTIDSADPRHHMECSNNDIFHVQKRKWHRSRDPTTKRSCMNWAIEGDAHCGLVLTGTTYKSQNEHYVVVPAHFILGESCKKLLEAADTTTVESVRSEIEGSSSRTTYVLNKKNSPAVCDIQPIPMFAYRHSFSKDSLKTSYSHFTNDLAILKLEPRQLFDEGKATIPGVIQLSNLRSAMTEGVFPKALHEAAFAEHVTNISCIFPLQHRETLVEMGHQRVCVIADQMRGQMVACGESIMTPDRICTSAIEFVLFGSKLKAGDSGRIIYVEDARDGRLYPFGMFIGKSLRAHSCGQTIYRAVVLKKAIEEIEDVYAHIVYNLRPLSRFSR